MERTIYHYRNQRGTTDLSLAVTRQGVVLRGFSVFDTTSGEADIHTSKPFPVGDLSKGLDELTNGNECRLVELEQCIQIRKDRFGGCTFIFDGGSYSNRFEIQGLPFRAEAARNELDAATAALDGMRSA